MTRRVKTTFGLLSLLLMIGLAEGALRIPAGLRHVGEDFVRFPDGLVHFVASSSDSRFADPKPPNTFRVFCFGESAVEGSIYNPKSSFPKLLREMLQDLSRGVRVEVINCGATGTKSDFAARVFAESLRFQPDLMVIYSGNNEYAFYQRVNRVSHPSLYHLQRLLAAHSRIYYLSRLGFDSARGIGMGFAIRNLPASQMEHHPLFSARVRAEVQQDYQANLEGMVNQAGERGVEVLLARPVTNLKGWPPMKSACTFSEEKCNEADAVVRHARTDLTGGRSGTALAGVERALQVAPGHALAHFLAGRLLLDSDVAAARKNFETSLEEDDAPIFRFKPSQARVLQEIAARRRMALADFQEVFDQESGYKIAGFELLDDYCHPSLDGQALIAAGLAERIAADHPRLFRPADRASLWAARQEYLGRLGIDRDFIALRLQEMAFYLAFHFDDPEVDGQGIQLLRRQQSLVPDSVLAPLVEGLLMLRQGDEPTARLAFAAALRRNPDHAARMIDLYFRRFLCWQSPWLLVQSHPGISFEPILNDYLAKEKTSLRLGLDQADRVYRLAEGGLAEWSAPVVKAARERSGQAPAAPLELYPPPVDDRLHFSFGGLTRSGDRFAGSTEEPRLSFGLLEIDPRRYAALSVELETESLAPAGTRLCLYWRGERGGYSEENKACAEQDIASGRFTSTIPLADDPDWLLAGRLTSLRIDPGEGGISFRLGRVRLLPYTRPAD